jgi:TetR/AcrR family transcriptional regulator
LGTHVHLLKLFFENGFMVLRFPHIRVNYLVSMSASSPDSIPESSSKDRIIHAAEALFAQKGFEGARVDEIARQAGVNKALIYYYFKSKEEILHALMHHAIEDLVKHLGDPRNFPREWLYSDAILHELMIKFLLFIEEEKDLFTIVVMELLKDSERRALILSHLGEELGKQHSLFTHFDPAGDSLQGLVTEFFTGFLPFIMFVLLKEPWKKLYGMDEAVLKEMFLKAFEATHIRYTMDLIKSAGGKGGEEGAGE